MHCYTPAYCHRTSFQSLEHPVSNTISFTTVPSTVPCRVTSRPRSPLQNNAFSGHCIDIFLQLKHYTLRNDHASLSSFQLLNHPLASFNSYEPSVPLAHSCYTCVDPVADSSYSHHHFPLSVDELTQILNPLSLFFTKTIIHC